MTRILLILLLVHVVGAADSLRAATTAAEAEQQTAAGLRILQASDSSPRQSVAAALSFTAALGFYKAQSNTDKVCELQANLYWCKKRMTLDDVQAFLAAKSQDEGLVQLASQMTTATAATVPPEESAIYFSRAEKYAQQHPTEYFQVAIRYFEVADRFQGTSVSLTAQRKSLDAQRQANHSDAAVERIARDLPAALAVAGDLPAGAAKIVTDLNAIITTAAKSAAADVAKDEKRVVDALTKEAESEQKRGNLDGTIAIQKQASNLENDQPGLTKAAQAAMDSYRTAKGRVIDRTQAAIGKEQAKALKGLDAAQVDETKKGNVPGALAIKTKRNELADILAASAPLGAIAGTLYFQVDDSGSVCINGETVLDVKRKAGDPVEEVLTATAKLKAGDLISIFVVNTGGGHGFHLSFSSSEMRYSAMANRWKIIPKITNLAAVRKDMVDSGLPAVDRRNFMDGAWFSRFRKQWELLAGSLGDSISGAAAENDAAKYVLATVIINEDLIRLKPATPTIRPSARPTNDGTTAPAGGVLGDWLIVYASHKDRIRLLADGTVNGPGSTWTVKDDKLHVQWASGMSHNFDLKSNPITGQLSNGERVTLVRER